MKNSERFLVCLVLALALCLPVASFAGNVAVVDVGQTDVRWDVQGGDFEQVVLTVALPNGNVIRREIKGGQPLVFELDGASEDGAYTYELVGTPRLDAATRKELADARKAGKDSEVIERLKGSGKLPRESAVQSGSFSVINGTLVDPDQQEGAPRKAAKAGKSGGTPQIITAADQVIPDDLIVQGSGCFGFDCVNNESFGFDTIRMKENNTRIKFEDTSTGTFPTNDWQLTANDSASGGASKFSIEDITGAKVPFTIRAGAATNSVFVDSTGRVGFRTSTPVLDLHVATSNTPAIRLEQNNSGGFTAQTWDIGANEANFFVRDVTGGSLLPFRIRPGAPTSSLDISSLGRVGIGTGTVDAPLEIRANPSSIGTGNALIKLVNPAGPVAIQFDPTDDGTFWNLSTPSDASVVINRNGNVGTEFTLTDTGNLTITGTLRTGGPTCAAGCDAVFEPDYKLLSIAEHAEAMWANKHLPNVDPVKPLEPIDLTERFGQVLNELEVAHIYIEQLHGGMEELKTRVRALEAEKQN
jgi:hypothetical protein